MDSNYLAAETRWLDPDAVDRVEELMEEDCIKGDEVFDYFMDMKKAPVSAATEASAKQKNFHLQYSKQKEGCQI